MGYLCHIRNIGLSDTDIAHFFSQLGVKGKGEPPPSDTDIALIFSQLGLKGKGEPPLSDATLLRYQKARLSLMNQSPARKIQTITKVMGWKHTRSDGLEILSFENSLVK